MGWFLVSGKNLHLYTTHQAYEWLSFFALVVLFLVGFIIRNVSVEHDPITHVILPKASHFWQKVRLFTVIDGFIGGINLFVPTLMVLTFIGMEQAVGTVQSGAAILSAVVISYVAKRADRKHRLYILAINTILTLIAGIYFGVLFSALGTIIFFALTAVGNPFSWVGAASISQDSIDTEEATSAYSHYAYIFDTELFLNIGRIMGIGIFFLLIFLFTQTTALRISPLLFAVFQLPFLFMAYVLDKTNLHPSQ